MDKDHMLSSTVELALDLLEKRGSFSPFCRAIDARDQVFIYTSDYSGCASEDENHQIEKVVRDNVAKDIQPRCLQGAAFCFLGWVRFADSPEKTSVIRVELHWVNELPSLWHLPFSIESGKATVLSSHTENWHTSIFGEP
jgi:hypothetical protein